MHSHIALYTGERRRTCQSRTCEGHPSIDARVEVVGGAEDAGRPTRPTRPGRRPRCLNLVGVATTWWSHGHRSATSQLPQAVIVSRVLVAALLMPLVYNAPAVAYKKIGQRKDDFSGMGWKIRWKKSYSLSLCFWPIRCNDSGFRRNGI